MKKPLVSLCVFLVPVLAVLFSIPIPAYAYIDPGTGSYLLQVTLAVVFAAVFAVKHYFKRIKSLLKRNRQKDTSIEPK
jgi:uncharacterized membrane protein